MRCCPLYWWRCSEWREISPLNSPHSIPSCSSESQIEFKIINKKNMKYVQWICVHFNVLKYKDIEDCKGLFTLNIRINSAISSTISF